MDLSDTDKLAYVALLERTTLSQKNKWIDKEGHIFIVFEVAKLARYVGKSETIYDTYKKSYTNNKNNNNKNINNLYSFEDEFNYTKGGWILSGKGYK